jgi:hypothetical protein
MAEEIIYKKYRNIYNESRCSFNLHEKEECGVPKKEKKHK